MPRIQVFIPVFNRRDLVGAAVSSALAQDLPDYQVVVVDNCSTDGTWEYLQTLDDPRLQLHRNDTNLGLFGNFNRCGELATAAYVLFLCSDDRLSGGFLAQALASMESHGHVAMLSSRGRQVDGAGRTLGDTGSFLAGGVYGQQAIIGLWYWVTGFYGRNIFNYPSGILFRGEPLRRALPFRSSYGSVADIDLFLRVLDHGDLLVTEDVGCEILVHPGQIASDVRRSGDYIRELLDLIESRRDSLENRCILRLVQRQVGASVLAWNLRRIADGDFKAFGRADRFGVSGRDIVIGGLVRAWSLALEKLFNFRRPAPNRAAETPVGKSGQL